jgi:hypothetical protein
MVRYLRQRVNPEDDEVGRIAAEASFHVLDPGLFLRGLVQNIAVIVRRLFAAFDQKPSALLQPGGRETQGSQSLESIALEAQPLGSYMGSLHTGSQGLDLVFPKGSEDTSRLVIDPAPDADVGD